MFERLKHRNMTETVFERAEALFRQELGGGADMPPVKKKWAMETLFAAAMIEALYLNGGEAEVLNDEEFYQGLLTGEAVYIPDFTPGKIVQAVKADRFRTLWPYPLPIKAALVSAPIVFQSSVEKSTGGRSARAVIIPRTLIAVAPRVYL
jgi:hypothetical protein